jgi:hypothetical protein
MKSKKIQKNIEALRVAIQNFGYTEDKYGHFHKTESDGKQLRYKFGQGALRKEIKGVGRWIRIISGSYGNLSVTEDGKIKGLK